MALSGRAILINKINTSSSVKSLYMYVCCVVLLLLL